MSFSREIKVGGIFMLVRKTSTFGIFITLVLKFSTCIKVRQVMCNLKCIQWNATLSFAQSKEEFHIFEVFIKP